jgi:predicted lipoprotein with Yx(FWY)xxD motif
VLALGYGAVQVAAQETPREQPTPTTGRGTEQARPAVQRPTGPARIGVRDQAPFGQILVDANGRALYVFSTDTGMRSSCEGDCARAWPPVLTQGAPTAMGRGVRSQMLGSIERPDGTSQVTYNQMPLYTFAQDRRAGEIRGQRMRGHGGEWFLIGPDGNRIERRIEETPSATPSAPPTGTREGAPRESTTGTREGAPRERTTPQQ